MTVCVAKESPVSIFFSERHMQVMWLEQKYFSELRDGEGNKVEVVSPGAWNSESGPDFKKAHLRIDGQDLYGDIELHLREDSWYQHGHHNDSRYDNVIAHVIFFASVHRHDAMTNSGKTIGTICLEDRLTIPLKRIVRNIDLDLYPYRRFSGAGQCSLMWRRSSKMVVKDILIDAVKRRFIEKVEYLQNWTGDDFIAGGIARALGYKNNAQQFLQLFLILRQYRHLEENDLLALALKLTGFFDDKYQRKWKGSSYYQELLQRSEYHQVIDSIKLDTAFIRPPNNPVRRIVAMVKMVVDDLKIRENLLYIWQHYATDNQQLRRELEDLFPLYEDDYWCWHYNFELANQAKYIPLVGSTVRREIVANVLLPALYKIIADSEKELLLDFFCSLSVVETSKSRYLKHRFFGDSKRGLFIDNGCMQQGTYQIHREFCQHFEVSCEGCPFTKIFE